MKQIFKELGLNERETDVYLTLLKEGSITASKIAKLTKINRTTTYLELENLIDRGVVSYVIKDSKRHYRATSPEKFIHILDEKKKNFQAILPQLQGLHKSIDPFNFEVFEGKEGIKTFYMDIYHNAKEFLVLGATGKATEVLKYSYPHFVNKFLKKKIKERALANESSREIMESHPKSIVKIKYLPSKYEFDVTTIIYGNKIAIQSLQKDNIYVVVIKDNLLHKSYKNHFELLWSLL
jgi:sugar-specific transcriptional regulator TrmB